MYQWLRIHLQKHGTQVGSLVQEDSTCCRETKPMCPNYPDYALETRSRNYGSPHALSQQSDHSVVSDSLRPHGLQRTRLPCPSPTPRACSNSCPSSRRCHPTITFSVVPFSSCLQSFPASGSFPMSWFFPSGGQSIGTSASASVLPMNIQD